ncbi:MAG: VWA domain-containing protein [Pseudomonadota bacterium]
MYGLLKSFVADRRGNVALIFAIVILPLLFLTGYAIDLRNASNLQSALQDVLDAASLAGGRALQEGDNDEEIEATVAAFVNGFVDQNSHRMVCGDTSINVVRAETRIDTRLDCNVTANLSHIMGIDQIAVAADSEARFDLQSVDVAFVLDVSSSMNDDRLEALRDAATSAVQLLLPSTPAATSELRIAFAPYSHVVNAGSYFEDLTNEDEARTYSREVLDDGQTCSGVSDCLDELQSEGLETVNAPFTGTCVWERGGSDAATDAAPGNNRYLNTGNPVWFFDANDQEKAKGLAGNTTMAPGGFFSIASGTALNMRYANCQSSTILPLTDDQSDAIDYVESLTDRGRGTNGALGLAMGWYLISDKWRSVWPIGSKPQNDGAGVSKYIILMTDGIFDDWRLDTATYGDQATQALTICDALKADGVTIFTVSFQAPAAATTLLRQCATSSGTAFVSGDAMELEENFSEIARRIRPLRISR